MSTTRSPFQKVVLQPGAIYESNLSLTTALTSATLTAPSNNGPFGVIPESLRSEQLEHEAFEVPVEELIDLWLGRFGNDWVDLEKIDEDHFWAMAYRRLKTLGELEIHYLTDRARYVCRKPK